MKVESIELHRIGMPLVRPFETSFGRETERVVLLVHLLTDVGEGWGECVAGSTPSYSSEYVDGCAHVIEHHLAPLLFAVSDIRAAGLERLFAPVVGHRITVTQTCQTFFTLRLRRTREALTLTIPKFT